MSTCSVARTRSQSRAMRRSHHLRGISLVEVLLSVALVSVVIYVIVTLFPMAVVEMKKSHDAVAAGNLAQRLLEQMRSEPFDTLTPKTTSTEQVGSTEFTLVRESALESDTSVKHLRVTLSWSTAVAGSPNTLTASKTYETSVFRFTNP